MRADGEDEAPISPPASGLESGAVDLSDIRAMDYAVFAVFWALVVVVFLQFFSRYVLNDSIPWTEEVARYLLIVVAFSGSAICVRRGSHIRLEFFHKYLSDRLSHGIQTAMDLVAAGFFGYIAYSGVALVDRIGGQPLISVDISRAPFFWIVILSLAASAAITLWRRVAGAGRPEE